MTNTAVFAASRGYALTSSRTTLIRQFLKAGWRVVLVTADDADSRQLVDLGALLEPVRFQRGGVAPVSDMDAVRELNAIYQRHRPAVVHHFHAKPVILGTLVARRRMGQATRVVNTITGLGHAFIKGGPSGILPGLGYRWALPRADATVFQNRDDRDLFVARNWVCEDRAHLIVGSGVNLDQFSWTDRGERDPARPVIVMVGRLLWQKGIREFIEVAGRIHNRWPCARFVLAGEEDLVHPDAVSRDWLHRQSHVEFVGRLSSIAPLLAEADLLLFPSYREGVPRVVMEAASSGLPTVAFDVPGVREAVHHGETGYLVPWADIDALTNRVTELLKSTRRRVAMGRSARRLAEQVFDRKIIHEQYVTLYRSLHLKI